MPLYALVDNTPTRALRDGPRRASCVDCGADMLAKTGDVKVWHWAHYVESPDCASAGEGEWHLSWKELAPDGSQERTVGNRRADVLAPGGFTVEFQASPMTRGEVAQREADWGSRLVWIFDAAEAYEEARLELRQHPDRDNSDAYRNIRWARAPERVRGPRCRTLLDTGRDWLVLLGRWYDNASPLQGYGWAVTRDWVIVNVLHGDRIPALPGYKVPVSSRKLAAASRRQASRLAGQVGAGDCPDCHEPLGNPPGARCSAARYHEGAAA